MNIIINELRITVFVLLLLAIFNVFTIYRQIIMQISLCFLADSRVDYIRNVVFTKTLSTRDLVQQELTLQKTM